MDLPYQYTSLILPLLAFAVFVTALGVYCVRRGSVPGAFPLGISMLLDLPWALGAVLELMAVDVSTKIFWAKFQELWPPFITIATFCFALEYAYLGHWLNRRTLTLLTLPAWIQTLLILTNDLHHWMWVSVSFNGDVQLELGAVAWITLGYGILLVAAHVFILLWLFVRAPFHRWPIGLLLINRLFTATAYLLDTITQVPFAPMSLTILMLGLASGVYVLVLFRFRLFDLVPIARSVLIERMREGMLVVDQQNRIVDLNRATEKILNLRAPQLFGKDIAQALSALPDLLQVIGNPVLTHSEIAMETASGKKYLDIDLSVLANQRGLAIGRLVLVRDITEGKRAQEQVLEQQRALASIAERERLARELHDGLAQTLGYVKLRTQTARDLLAQHQVAAADTCLKNLGEVVQEAHIDIREYLLSASASVSSARSFWTALQEYLDKFSEHYAIRSELIIAPEIDQAILEATTQVQLLRIIQEALTNARKHARANEVRVSFVAVDHQAQIVIQDDGVGFDPAILTTADGQKYGLRFMRERAEQVGGSVHVESTPSHGTRVIVQVPLNAKQELRT